MKWVARLASVGLLLLSGCGNFFSSQNGGGGGGNTNADDVLYFLNTGTANNISAYSVSTTGVLSALSGSPYAVGVVPTSMAITPGNTYLYVGGATGILGYSVSTTGQLTALNSSAPLATDVLAPQSMVVDATGTYLLTSGIDLSTNIGAPQIYEYQIDASTGKLTLATGFPFAVANGNGSTSTNPGNSPTQLYLAPNNQFLYLTLASGGTELLGFVPSNGTVNDLLKHINLTTNGTAQINVIANANSSVLYVTETGVGVRAFPLNTDGSTGTELSASPFKTGTGATALSFDTTGDYLYITNKGDNTISGYSVASSGALTALASSPFTSGGTLPLSLTLDKTKDFLAVANSGGNANLATFSFDATTGGKLDAVTNTVGTTATGTNLVIGTH
jgi:6-phosphogluconolactonase (cycloisomerase 2 family)